MAAMNPGDKLARILAKSRFGILDGLALADGELPTNVGDVKWHLVALEGSWKGHWQGPFRITGETLQSMSDHFGARAIPLVVDYEHQSLTMDRAPAAGWINELDLREGDKGAKELWARIEWTERAAGHIRSKEYRFKSPTIQWQTRDRVSGKIGGASLHSVALTNHPFLHELPEVTLNSMAAAFGHIAETEQETMNEDQIKELCALLGLADDADAPKILAAVKAAQATGTTLNDVFAALGEGVKDLDGAKSRILTLSTAATSAGEAGARIAALESQVATFEATAKEKAALDLVRKYQAERKVAADATDNFKAALAHATADPKSFAAFMDSIEPWVAGGDTVPERGRRTSAGAGGGPKKLSDLDPQTRASAESLGLTDEDVEKYGSDILG